MIFKRETLVSSLFEFFPGPPLPPSLAVAFLLVRSDTDHAEPIPSPSRSEHDSPPKPFLMWEDLLTPPRHTCLAVFSPDRTYALEPAKQGT